MFDLGWQELFVIGTVTLIVVGPKDLPNLLNRVGKVLGKIKQVAREFYDQINETAEIEEFNNKVLDILNGMYWFDRKLFTLYVKQFNSIRKLAKETRLGHVTVYNTIKRAKKNIKKKLYEK